MLPRHSSWSDLRGLLLTERKGRVGKGKGGEERRPPRQFDTPSKKSFSVHVARQPNSLVQVSPVRDAVCPLLRRSSSLSDAVVCRSVIPTKLRHGTVYDATLQASMIASCR